VSAELVYGIRSVEALMARDLPGVLELWVQNNRAARLEAVQAAARRHGIAISLAPRRTLNALVDGASHQGLVCRYRASRVAGPMLGFECLLEGIDSTTLLLVLDSVQDPHNLGACLRSAGAAGAQAVLIPRHRAARMSATVRKVACGAAEVVPVVRPPNLARALDTLRDAGVHVVGADADAPAALYEADLRGALALVVGGEESGLRRLTREKCDTLARIPMAGGVASLNVSVAAGICLFEARRQRGA